MSNPDSVPLVSVVLVCHNDGKWLPRCLESLRTQTYFDRLELIIADNASSDGTDQIAQQLIQEWPNARFLPTGGDNGFAKACNLGALAARGEYVYLLSPDTWLEPDCLEQFYLALEREKATAGGCTILEYDDNAIQARGSHGFDLFGNPVSPAQNRVPEPLFCIAGFCFIHRQTFIDLGMLDDRLFMYCEETDLAWRVWISGKRFIAAPLARVHHRGAVLVNPAGGTRPVENRTSTQKRFLANRNALVVLAKNCQHLLLLMLPGCIGLVLLEALVILMVSRSWTVTRSTTLDALLGAWSLRGHIGEQRRRIKQLRLHGDFWMLRFLRFGFGRWGEVQKMLRLGLPKVSR